MYDTTHYLRLAAAQHLHNAHANRIVTNLHPGYTQKCAVLLRLLRPDATRVIIPFDRNIIQALPYGMLPDACNGFNQTCRDLGLGVVYIGFSPPRFPINTVLARTRTGDIIVVRPEYGLRAHVEELVSICSQRRITVFGSDLTIVRLGAAIGLVSIGSPSKNDALRLAAEQSTDNKDAHILSQTQRICYNLSTIAEQGVHITQRNKTLLHVLGIQLINIDFLQANSFMR